MSSESNGWAMSPKSIGTHVAVALLTFLVTFGGYRLVSPADESVTALKTEVALMASGDLVNALKTQVALLTQTVSMLKETVDRLRTESERFATEDWVLQEMQRSRDRQRAP